MQLPQLLALRPDAYLPEKSTRHFEQTSWQITESGVENG